MSSLPNRSLPYLKVVQGERSVKAKKKVSPLALPLVFSRAKHPVNFSCLIFNFFKGLFLIRRLRFNIRRLRLLKLRLRILKRSLRIKKSSLIFLIVRQGKLKGCVIVEKGKVGIRKRRQQKCRRPLAYASLIFMR